MRLSSLLQDGEAFFVTRERQRTDMDKPIEEQPVVATGPLTLKERPGLIAIEPHCPKCTGPMIKCQIGHVGIYGWWLERVARQAGALGPPRTVTSDVAAMMCIRCGYVEFYAVEPAALLGGDEAH